MMNNNETALYANEIMADYVRNNQYLTDGYDISGQDNDDEINGVCADYRAYYPNEKKYVYFEVKGTTKLNPIWGAITHKELKAALQASEKGYLYFFAVIYIQEFHNGVYIHPKRSNKEKNIFSNFMTLEEIMTFSKSAKISVDFKMNCSNRIFDNPQKVRFQDRKRKPISVNDVKEAIEKFNL